MYNPQNKRINNHAHHADQVFFKVLKVAILFIVCVILIFSAYKLYRKYNHTRLALIDGKAELAKLHESERLINTSIERLSSVEGVEYEIRDKYRVTKQNEKMIIVIDNYIPPTITDNAGSIFVKFKEWVYNL